MRIFLAYFPERMDHKQNHRRVAAGTIEYICVVRNSSLSLDFKDVLFGPGEMSDTLALSQLRRLVFGIAVRNVLIFRHNFPSPALTGS